MKRYLVRGRSIDGTVWALVRNGTLVGWTGEKAHATHMRDASDAERVVAMQGEENTAVEPDAMVGRLSVVEVEL